MPLPKPSKMISKRFKKTSPALLPPPASSPSSSPLLLPLSSSCEQPWPAPHPLREWKIRVVCTDPDATDDSSSDEAQPFSPSISISASSSPSRRKRLIREFSLPLPSPPSPPSTPQPCRSVRRRPRRRSPRPDLSIAIAAETDALAAAGDACPPSAIASSSACNANEEEEFARFLQEFLPAQEEECEWELGRSSRSESLFGSGGLGDILDLELDSEALSWINSMQRLP